MFSFFVEIVEPIMPIAIDKQMKLLPSRRFQWKDEAFFLFWIVAIIILVHNYDCHGFMTAPTTTMTNRQSALLLPWKQRPASRTVTSNILFDMFASDEMMKDEEQNGDNAKEAGTSHSVTSILVQFASKVRHRALYFESTIFDFLVRKDNSSNRYVVNMAQCTIVASALILMGAAAIGISSSRVLQRLLLSCPTTPAGFCSNFLYGFCYVYKYPFLRSAGETARLFTNMILPLMGMLRILAPSDLNIIDDSDSSDVGRNNNGDESGKYDQPLQEQEEGNVVTAVSVLAELLHCLNLLTLALLEFPLVLIKLPATLALTLGCWMRLEFTKDEKNFQYQGLCWYKAKTRISSLGLAPPTHDTYHHASDLPGSYSVLLGPLKEELQCRFIFDKVWHGLSHLLRTMLVMIFPATTLAAPNVQQLWFGRPAWVIANSILFGLSRLGNYFPRRAEGLTSRWTSEALLRFATIQYLLCALGALFLLNPVYLERGLAGAFGAHVAWNGFSWALINIFGAIRPVAN